MSEMIPYDEMPHYYNLADISVMIPNTDQGPLSMYEAMFCGNVVVASDVKGNREMIRDDDNGYLVDPKDVKGLEQKMSLALDPEVRQRFYEKNKAWIEEHANWDKNSKRMEQLYEQALSNGQ